MAEDWEKKIKDVIEKIKYAKNLIKGGEKNKQPRRQWDEKPPTKEELAHLSKVKKEQERKKKKKLAVVGQDKTIMGKIGDQYRK